MFFVFSFTYSFCNLILILSHFCIQCSFHSVHSYFINLKAIPFLLTLPLFALLDFKITNFYYSQVTFIFLLIYPILVFLYNKLGKSTFTQPAILNYWDKCSFFFLPLFTLYLIPLHHNLPHVLKMLFPFLVEGALTYAKYKAPSSLFILKKWSPTKELFHILIKKSSLSRLLLM